HLPSQPRLPTTAHDNPHLPSQPRLPTTAHDSSRLPTLPTTGDTASPVTNDGWIWKVVSE
ncbi:MAG: hypothetical protein LBS59_08835, partial [Puniceicoccales bacterium]|nr:hypothetical protein [Puniceicoccales bacterium]